MALRGVVTIILLLIALVGFGASPILGVFLLALTFLAYYYLSPRCPQCGARFSSMPAGSAEVNQERAYGIVTRKDVTTKQSRDSDGRVRSYDETTTRQERAPVVRTTTRYNYKCSKCGRSSFKDRVTQEEDFSRVEEPSEKQTVIIQKEIVKVPCKYCGVLNEVTAGTCSNCGAAFKP